MKWPWGRDRTWTNGAWRDTEPMAARAGAGALLSEPIKEPAGKKVWGLLGVAISVPFALWTLTSISISYSLLADEQMVSALAMLLVSLAILGWSLRSVVKAHTRRVQFDQTGLSDADFFGVRRVPWGEIRNLVLVNLNADAQARYARTRVTEREGSRPKDDWGARDVCGEQGVALLRIHKNMVPWDALTALRQRIEKQLRDGRKEASIEARDRKQIEEHEAIARRMDQVEAGLDKRFRSVEGVMKGFMALTFLLPLAGTCYFGYHSLWFRFVAAEAQGQVVQTGPLVVLYRDAAGQPLRTVSDSSEYVAVGADVRVFYDREDPDRVRLDLFEEMWANTALLGGLTLFVGLLAAPVWWGMRRAKAGSKARRAARAN